MLGKISLTSVLSISGNGFISSAIKRLFDIVASAIGLILICPVLGLIALAIKKDSPGPVFYQGRRIGRNGKVFKILKFRTMYEDSTSYSGPKVTAHNDLRITPIGHWLRDTKLNELPQLWNVLKGDMSLVGPRPEDPELAKSWPIEVWNEVLAVRPGITSPASVQYRNEESLLSASNVLFTYIQKLVPDKTRLDQLYVRNRSFWLDLDTLLWTFLILLPRLGEHTPPEHLLLFGPISRLMRRYVNWFLIDMFVTFGAIGFTGLIWRATGPLDIGWPISIATGIGFALIFSLIGAVLGVNKISWARAQFADIYDLVPAWALSSVMAFFANEVARIFPYKMVIVACIVALGGYVITRYRSRVLEALLTQLTRHWIGEQVGRERVLIIGGGSTAQHAAWLLDHISNANKYWVVGFVDDDMYKQGMRIYGANVLGKIDDIPSLIKKYDVGVVIMADYHNRQNGCHYIIDLCSKTQANLVLLPDILGVFNNLFETQQPQLQSQVIPVTSNDDEMNCYQCMTKYASKIEEAQRVAKRE